MVSNASQTRTNNTIQSSTFNKRKIAKICFNGSSKLCSSCVLLCILCYIIFFFVYFGNSTTPANSKNKTHDKMSQNTQNIISGKYNCIKC